MATKIRFQQSPLFCCSEDFVETGDRKSLTGGKRDLVKNAVPSIFTWSDRNDEVRQRSERARIRGDKTTKPVKRKATKTRNMAHWSAMDVSVSDKGTAWIVRAWPDTRTWCNYCLWCGCPMCKLSLHITGKFACAAFRRKDIKEHLPDLFQGKYEIVQGILDCTEVKCEPSKGFQKDSGKYSDYKSHDTFKGPVCISPSGWITVVSHLCPGGIINKDNCREKQFLSTNWNSRSAPCRQGFWNPWPESPQRRESVHSFQDIFCHLPVHRKPLFWDHEYSSCLCSC